MRVKCLFLCLRSSLPFCSFECNDRSPSRLTRWKFWECGKGETTEYRPIVPTNVKGDDSPTDTCPTNHKRNETQTTLSHPGPTSLNIVGLCTSSYIECERMFSVKELHTKTSRRKTQRRRRVWYKEESPCKLILGRVPGVWSLWISLDTPPWRPSHCWSDSDRDRLPLWKILHGWERRGIEPWSGFFPSFESYVSFGHTLRVPF